MAKKRAPIPRATKDAVLREFRHRCAVCGRDRPQVHHIDENPSNNDALNLIPLCPNCHLTDQHDASNAVPVGKLRFFRRHKHRNILKPQFNPLFRRMAFLSEISDTASVNELEEQAMHLYTFVQNLTMGDFYSAAIWKRLEPPSGAGVVVIGDPASEARSEHSRQEQAANYRAQLRAALAEVESLVVELLEYQQWPSGVA